MFQNFAVDLVRARSRVFGGLACLWQLIFWERFVIVFLLVWFICIVFCSLLCFNSKKLKSYFCGGDSSANVYFISYAFTVFLLYTIDFKVVYFFCIFSSQLSYCVPGLIYRFIPVERAGKLFPVFLLVIFSLEFWILLWLFSTGWGVARDGFSWIFYRIVLS